MRKIIAYLIIVTIIFGGCAIDSKEKKHHSLKITPEVDSLLRSDQSSGLIADSLRKLFFTIDNDTQAINVLNQIAYYWKGSEIKLIALETQKQSKKIGYDYGYVDGVDRYGYYLYWNYQDDSARIYYDRALMLAEKGGYVTIQANVLCDIADLHRIHYEHEKAIEKYNTALKLAMQTENDALVARIYCGLADVNRLIGKTEESEKFYKQSIAVSRKSRDYQRMGFCYAYIGDLYRLRSDFPTSMHYFNLALPLSQKANDQNNVCNCYCTMGELYRHLFDNEKGIEFLKKGLAIAEKLNNKTHQSFAHGSLGAHYNALRKYDLARFHFAEQLRISTEFNEVTSIINSSVSLADLLINKFGDHDSSIAILNKAVDLSKKIDFKNGLARAYFLLAHMHLLNKNFVKAIEYGNKSIEVCKKGDLRIDLIDASSVLSQAHEALNNLKPSIEMYKLNFALRDSVYNEEQVRKFSAIEFQGKETELRLKQKERENLHRIEQAKKDEEINHQRFVRNAFILGFVLIGIFSVLLFRSLRQNKKQKEIIQHQKEVVEEKQKEVMDSIRYARRIQTALLPSQKYIDKVIKKLKSDK